MLTVYNRYGNSVKALHSTNGPVLLLGSLVLTKLKMTAALNNITKPITLSVQGKPILFSKACAIAGNTIPPVVPPQATHEIAIVQLRVK